MKVTVRTSLRRYGTDRSAPTGCPPLARHVWPVTTLRWRSPGNPATPFLPPSTTTGGACARAGAGSYAAWVPHGNLHGRTCGVSHAGMRASAFAIRSRRTSLAGVARKTVRCTASEDGDTPRLHRYKFTSGVHAAKTQMGRISGPFALPSTLPRKQPAYFSFAAARSASARSVFSHENDVALCCAPVPSV